MISIGLSLTLKPFFSSYPADVAVGTVADVLDVVDHGIAGLVSSKSLKDSGLGYGLGYGLGFGYALILIQIPGLMLKWCTNSTLHMSLAEIYDRWCYYYC